MSLVELFTYYFGWHYSRALSGIFVIWSNFIWFLWHFFSISLLFKSWFAPWKRLKEHYQGGLDLNNLFEMLLVNILMRIVGFAMRSFVMLVGFLALALLSILGILFTIIWLVLPVLVILFLLLGIGKIL